VQKWGVLALLPVYHPLRMMQAVTTRWLAQGGRVLSLTWHSSEMMPGAAPHMPDAAAVDRFLEKICRYLRWLTGRVAIQGRTLDDLRQTWDTGPAGRQAGGGGPSYGGDWRY
jgi:hypothetical protein